MELIEKDNYFLLRGPKTFDYRTKLKDIGGIWRPDEKAWKFTTLLPQLKSYITESNISARKCNLCDEIDHDRHNCPIKEIFLCDYCKKVNKEKCLCREICCGCGKSGHKICKTVIKIHFRWKYYAARDENIMAAYKKENDPYDNCRPLKWCYCNDNHLCTVCEHVCCEEAVLTCSLYGNKLEFSCKVHNNINTVISKNKSDFSDDPLYEAQYYSEIKRRQKDINNSFYTGD